MKLNLKRLLAHLAIPLAVGGLSALLSVSGMRSFAALPQPGFAPPGWLFPVVWTLLYLLMGVASYLVAVSGGQPEAIRSAMHAYAAQLVLNFFWSIIFFDLQLFGTAFFWLILLWGAILLNIVRFWRLSRPAGVLLLPYLAWVSFAGVLTFAIWMLNR